MYKSWLIKIKLQSCLSLLLVLLSTHQVFSQTVAASNQKELRLNNTANTQSIKLIAPPTLSSGYTLELPGSIGGSGQVLGADIAGKLVWITPVNGTVTSIALATGTSGTDIGIAGSPITSNGTITLNIPTASASNRGALSSADWTSFNNKIGGSGTINYVPKFTAAGTLSNSIIFDNGTNIGIGDATPAALFTVGNNDLFQVNAAGAIAAATGITTNGNILINPSASNVAGQLQLRNPEGTFQSVFQAGAQTANITYTLPTTAPTAGQVLSSDASGNMSWVTGGGSSGWALTGNASINPATQFIGTTDAQAFVVRTNNTSRLTIASGGDATFTGNVTATAFFESSDARLKNIISRDGDLVRFTWKDARDKKLHIGYIAQEVQAIMPDQVKADEKGMLSVNYIEVLVAKIRVLEKQIAQLEQELKNK